MSGILSKFRSKGVRPSDYRWVEADRIVSEHYGRYLLDSEQSKRAVWHPDTHVRTIVRLMALTNKLSYLPQDQDLRPGDEHYLAAIDFMREDVTSRSRNTLECLLIGGASNEVIANHLMVEPEMVQLCHDIFFDVRDRLDRPLLIQDIFFPPAMMQGGAKDPVSVERVIAYLTGHQLFWCFRVGLYEDDKVRVAFDKLQRGLMQNQTLSALLRRSWAFESTEGVLEHMQQHLLVTARAAAAVDANTGEDQATTRVRNGVQHLLAHNLKPEVVNEGDQTFSNMTRESATAAVDRVQETLK